MPLHDVWSRVLARMSRRKRRLALFFAARRLEAFRALQLPGHDEIPDRDKELLAALYELPHWQAFLRYQEIERQADMNNGLVLAEDARQIGEVQGSIGRMNKAESDVRAFWMAQQEERRQDAESKALAQEEDEGQDDAV